MPPRLHNYRLALAFRRKKERRRIEVEALRSAASGEGRARGSIRLIGGTEFTPAARPGEIDATWRPGRDSNP